MKEVSRKTKAKLLKIFKGVDMQIMPSSSNGWVDFNGLKHGNLIFDDEVRFRAKPEEKTYYYARFENGAITGMFDSLDKVEAVAIEDNDGLFTVYKMNHDLSFDYKSAGESVGVEELCPK